MSTQKQIIFLPPLFRFLMELTAWGYFIILTFTVDFLYIIVTLISIFLLASFNFSGDKKNDGPINIPGWTRILNEWFSGGLLSIFGAYLLWQEVGAILQIILILFVIILDRKRYYWMLGYSNTAPEYVTVLREMK